MNLRTFFGKTRGFLIAAFMTFLLCLSLSHFTGAEAAVGPNVTTNQGLATYIQHHVDDDRPGFGPEGTTTQLARKLVNALKYARSSQFENIDICEDEIVELQQLERRRDVPWGEDTNYIVVALRDLGGVIPCDRSQPLPSSTVDAQANTEIDVALSPTQKSELEQNQNQRQALHNQVAQQVRNGNRVNTSDVLTLFNEVRARTGDVEVDVDGNDTEIDTSSTDNSTHRNSSRSTSTDLSGDTGSATVGTLFRFRDCDRELELGFALGNQSYRVAFADFAARFDELEVVQIYTDTQINRAVNVALDTFEIRVKAQQMLLDATLEEDTTLRTAKIEMATAVIEVFTQIDRACRDQIVVPVGVATGGSVQRRAAIAITTRSEECVGPNCGDGEQAGRAAEAAAGALF